LYILQNFNQIIKKSKGKEVEKVEKLVLVRAGTHAGRKVLLLRGKRSNNAEVIFMLSYHQIVLKHIQLSWMNKE